MSRRFSPIVVPAVVAVLAAAVAFSTASAQGPTCSSIYTYRAVETPLRVSSDLTVRLRNPYGAVVNIGRFFVQVRIVYASDADRAKVASVQRALDGQPNRWKRGGDRDAHLFAFFHLGEGPHVIDVTITPTGGTPVTGHIAFIATRCEPKSFAAEAEHRKAPGHQPFAFWVYAGSTPMRQIDIARASARISTPPPALRGRKVGELRLGATPDSAVALRLLSRWSDPHAVTLLRHGALRVVLHPGRRRFLTVTGLPADNATNISLSFGGPRTASADRRIARRIATAIGPGDGIPGRARSSCRSRRSVRAATCRAFWRPASALSRRCCRSSSRPMSAACRPGASTSLSRASGCGSAAARSAGSAPAG